MRDKTNDCDIWFYWLVVVPAGKKKKKGGVWEIYLFVLTTPPTVNEPFISGVTVRLEMEIRCREMCVCVCVCVCV